MPPNSNYASQPHLIAPLPSLATETCPKSLGRVKPCIEHEALLEPQRIEPGSDGG